MKVVINTINIFHIHDNKYTIDNRHNGKDAKIPCTEINESNITDFVSHVVVNEEEQNIPLIAQLKSRVQQSENEIKELLEQLNHKSK